MTWAWWKKPMERWELKQLRGEVRKLKHELHLVRLHNEQRRWPELVRELRRVELEAQSARERCRQLQREKDELRHELHRKAVTP